MFKNEKGNVAIIVTIALFAIVVGTGFATAYYVNNQRAEAKKNAPAPTPTPSATPTSTPKATQAPQPQAKTQPAAPTNCTRLNIREGEFASNKCYSAQDYDDLVYYLDRYNSAIFIYNGTISSMNITCSGSEFFKDKCEADKAKKAQAEADIAKYKITIQGIIARGK